MSPYSRGSITRRLVASSDIEIDVVRRHGVAKSQDSVKINASFSHCGEAVPCLSLCVRPPMSVRMPRGSETISGDSVVRPEQRHSHHAVVKVRQAQDQRLPLALIYGFGFCTQALGLRL